MSNETILLTVLSVNNENLATSRTQSFTVANMRGGYCANLNPTLQPWGDTQEKPTGTNIANYYALLGNSQFVYLEDGDAGVLMTKYTVHESTSEIDALINPA